MIPNQVSKLADIKLVKNSEYLLS